MKRLFAFFLVLFFVVPTALADTDTDIVFHSIPWGISLDELTQQLKDKGIPSSAIDVYNDDNMAIWTYRFRNDYQYDIECTGHSIHVNLWFNDSVKIAGYPVNTMEFFTHYDISNNTLSKSTDASHYYMTKIWLSVSDEMAVDVYNDLYKKLTTLYAEGKTDTIKEVETTYTYTVWHGANNTAVCLFHGVSDSSDFQSVHLYYGITDIEKPLQTIREYVIQEQVKAVQNDMTGL